MIDINPRTLTGQFIQLEPLNETHREELHNIAQDKNIWVYTASNANGKNFDPWFNKALSLFTQQHHLPFVVRSLKSNKIIGSTRFYDISKEHHRLTIGYTWLIPEVWGTVANPESKLLLLAFAFEHCLVNRIELMTDARNLHSRAAIKKLGATEEGLLRQHMVLKDGYIRDTVIYSIIKTDWPQIKTKLIKRLCG